MNRPSAAESSRGHAQRGDAAGPGARPDIRPCPSEVITFAAPTVSSDHVDVFVMSGTMPVRSAVDWAELLIDRGAGRWGQFLWRQVLRLRLAPPGSADHIAGWRIDQRGDGWVRLGAAGVLMSGSLVVAAEGRQVHLGTYVRFKSVLGAWLWHRLETYHQRAVPKLLLQAWTAASIAD